MGLTIWFWIICVWAKAWFNHWKIAAIIENKQPAVLLATLAAVWSGYHIQSLFNVAVVSISVPFWIASALLFGLGESYGYKQVFESKPLLKFFTLSGALFCAILLPFFANRAYLADRHYNTATILVEETQRLDNQTLTDIYSKGESVYRQLKRKEDLFNRAIEEEFLIREKQLLQARETLHADASSLNSKKNDIRKTVETLLFLLSVNRQETALRLSPSEVKYHVFLGFLYEELFKRATIVNSKASWFELASVSYQKAIELNPENAYYRANLGRLHGMVASKPLDLAMTKAESFYMEAIQRARFTPLFYNNLNNLYITTGELKKVLETINLAENASPHMGGRVALTAGIVTYQYARDFLETGENEKAGIYGWWAFACMHKASQLNPNEADVFYYLAVFYYLKDEKEKASKYVSKALEINPTYARAVILSRKVNRLPKKPSRL